MAGSPAHAGIDLNAAMAYYGRFGFPRTRGDRPMDRQNEIYFRRVPPHTRG